MKLDSRHRVAWTIVLLLALLPLASIVILGSHGRIMGDDFCHLISGQEYGPWGNVLYWRNSLNGSFSFYFLHGLTAPLDTHATSIFVLVIIVAWTSGLAWLIYAGHQLFGRERPPLLQTIVVASAMVWLTIHGLITPLSIYYYSASTRHTLPIVILSTALAACCAIVPRIRSTRKLAVACAIFALVVFVNAGMSEVFATVQLALFTISLPAVYALTPRESRQNSLLLCRCGWVATVAGLLVMATAPGVANRLERLDSTTNSSLNLTADLIPNTLEHLNSFFTDTELITAFLGMLAISLVAMATVRRTTQTRPSGKPFQLSAPPLLLCLIAQLLLLPLAWNNQSDNPVVNGGYSPTLLVAGAHILLLASPAAILLARQKINAKLLKNPANWAAIPALTLGAVYILFGASLFRSAGWQAATYVSCSICSLLFALLWQFHIHLQADGRKDRFFEAGIWVMTAMGISVLALVVLNQAIGGKQFHYNLSFISFAFAFSGFICGISLAYAISQVNAMTGLATRPTLVIVFGSALVASAIWSGVMLGNAKHIPEFERFSQAWDERHQFILSKRESGELLEEPPRLPTEILDIPGGFWGYDYWLSWCASYDITQLIKDRYQAQDSVESQR